MNRFLAMFRRAPARPRHGEIAGSSIGNGLEAYIGELPLNPNAPARDAIAGVEQASELREYRQTLRDERCAAALDQRLNAAIGTPWEVVPGGEAEADIAAAADLAEQLERLDFARICRQLLHGVWYGWAVGESMWARDGARIALDDLVVRSPDRFWWAPDGELLLRTLAAPEGAPVPAGKFVVLARPGEHNDLPFAPGLARWCYWPVWLKRHGLKFWSVALERFGSPTAKGTYPRGAKKEEQDRLLRLINSLATGAGVAIPEGQDVELLETSRRAGGDYAEFCRYLDHMITTTILGQSSTTDQGQWRGTAEIQMEVRDETIAADVRLLDSALNTTIVRWLTEWNFPGAAMPAIRHDAEPADDLDARARREKVIAQTTGWRPTMEHVIDVYGGEWEDNPNAVVDDPTDDDNDATLAEGATDPPSGAAGGGRDAGGDEPDATAEEEDSPVPALTDRARRALGPAVDAWAARIRADLETAGSIEAFRERLVEINAWTTSPDAPMPDIADVVEALALALAAAHLAGRYDVEESPVELASAAAEHGRLPFAKQIAFFREKLNLSTAAWTDIWQAQHDRAFVVAGAAHADLVEDLRGAVDRAIAEGTTLADFRRDFDSIVGRHGWSYKGGRTWRTQVIYGTSVRTSYAAGRYRQMKEIADRRPYWRYRHSHASEDPREDHLSWDGLILPHDDPWWDTHYGPNGWGCKCYVEALSPRDLERLGKSGPDKAPTVNMRTVTVGANGPSPRTVEVPEGIDPGWAYAPGQSIAGESEGDLRAAAARLFRDGEG